MKNLIRSFIYAFKGIRLTSTGRNFRIQSGIACLVVAAGLYVNLNRTEWSIIILSIGFVLSLETINTAIENLVNLVMPQFNPLAGKIKDLAAGAVLIASIAATVVGVVIFSKYIF